MLRAIFFGHSAVSSPSQSGIADPPEQGRAVVTEKAQAEAAAFLRRDTVEPELREGQPTLVI